MSNNFISYTNLDHDSIKESIVSRLQQDSRFSNFQESSFYALLAEIFAATTDFTNYYVERRAEESYLDSAKLRSSVTLLSRMLGYSIRRPIPATTQIKITIKTLPAGIKVGDTLTIAQHTAFVIGGQDFITPISLFYKVTQADIDNFTIQGYFKELNYYSLKDTEIGRMYADNEFLDLSNSNPITLIQGTIKTYTIDAGTNTQRNTRYQKYIIKDKTFSNLFGTEDFGYDVKTGNTNWDNNLTRVKIGDNTQFTIDRISLTPSESISKNTQYGAGKNLNYCLIKTNVDDSVEVCFGDDVTSSIGVRTNIDHLYITYLSTLGASGNRIGVIGNLVDIQSNVLDCFNKSNIKYYCDYNQ